MKMIKTLVVLFVILVSSSCASPYRDDMGDLFGGAIADHIRKGE